jgi:hypothetical protein
VKEGKITIAQLVQQVNEVFPLEGETWGLEDYSVTVGGYECLHYHELGAVCRDEDEVVIRPLEYVDVRARAMTGRAQIAADGRHLLDGVPFGRPCLKGPIRPEVRIPPRKRRKLAADEETEGEQLMITQSEEEGEDDDDELDDEDFEVNDANESISGDETSDSEIDDTEDSIDSSGDSDSTSDNSDSSSKSDSDEESWSGIPASNQTTPKSKTASVLPNGTTPDDSRLSPTGTKRKRGSDTHFSESKRDPESRDYASGSGIPHEGNPLTKLRNQRRRDSRKLKHLKMEELLPPEADLKMMSEWNEGHRKRKVESGNGVEGGAENTFVGGTASASAIDEGVNRLKADVSNGSVTRAANGEPRDSTSPVQPDSSTRKIKASKRSKLETELPGERDKNLEEQRQKLLSQIAAGGVEVTEKDRQKKRRQSAQTFDVLMEDEDDPPQEMSSKQPPIGSVTVKDMMHTTEDNISTDAVAEVSTPIRRAQLDIAGSRRLLFGSLGVRVPKTQEERDLVQKKLAERPKRNANTLDEDAAARSGVAVIGTTNGTETSTGADDVEEDPGLWQEKIKLTAIECCDDGITLSTPPFPFYQRWDPQYNKKKKRNSSKYSANSKTHGTKRNSEYIETYDKYNINANGDALEYDDVSADEEYWEDGALLGDEEVEPDDDGFPDIPPEVDQLPRLLLSEVQEGDFVAFTELACDEATAWQPKMVTRTAKIIKVPSNEVDNIETAASPCIIQLSKRDLKPKVFDDEGNRVYSKFDMPDPDEEEDEGKREVVWQDLGDVKLVLRPEAAGDV